MPILSGRIGKWMLALSEFDLRYESTKAIKGHVMTDFVTQHRNSVDSLEVAPWILFFDRSTCGEGAGIGIVLISPQGRNYEFLLPIVATSTNNQVEYQALIKGLELLKEICVDTVEIFGDSMLVINQLARIYECRSEVLISYYERCLQLLKGFRDFRLEHVSRLHNEEANRLAQHASGYQPIQEVLTSAVDIDDWRREIVDYLKDTSKKVERRIRFQATKYVLLDDKLYYRTIDGVLLTCVSSDESKSLMGEIHEGVCGAHQSAFKMKWMIRRNGYYWLTILEDCFKYFKGCQGCQKFSNI
jgi:ribonuclease HI